MREPDVRMGRHTIRPEISRTFHFGAKSGASSNVFGKKLEKIKLNGVDVPWQDEDLSYLEKDIYRETYYKEVVDAKASNAQRMAIDIKEGNVRLEYRNWEGFQALAKKFNLMDDEKAGVARTAFENIVEFRQGGSSGNLVFLSPMLSTIKQHFQEGKRFDMKEFSQQIRMKPKPTKKF